jgi:putative transposase
MPRRPRIDIPDTVFHIYIRGHNKSSIFLDDQDRYTFLKYLRRASERCPWDLLGYCLMDNHYHLQVKRLSITLGATMHHLNTLYAGYFNYRYAQAGHVFQNRFHSIPVEVDSYLLALSRYIHLNPVEAGLVGRPQEYRWSSYREFIGGPSEGLIKSALVLDTLSENRERQQTLYREFVEDGIGKKSMITEEYIRKARVLGSDTFVKAIYARCPISFPMLERQSEKYSI